MKRIIEFQVNDNTYDFVENAVAIFQIDKNTRQFDVKSFYLAFFADKKDYSEIYINCNAGLSTDDKRILDAVSTLIENICTRLKTDLDQTNEQSVLSESLEDFKMH